MSNAFSFESYRHFVDEMASLMAPWGWPRPVARVFAYLLIREEPATLDEISAHLCIAKSAASVAARELERRGNARRQGRPGTKQIVYSALEKRLGPFPAQAAMMETMATLIRRQESESPKVAERLGHIADYLRAMSEAIEQVFQHPQFRD